MDDKTADKILGVILALAGATLICIVAFTAHQIFLTDGIKPDGVSAWIGFVLLAFFLVGYGIDYLTYSYQIFFRGKHILAVDEEEIRKRVEDQRREKFAS